MLPGFHAVQNLQLPLWRQIREMLQPLPKHLLLPRRKPPERLVILQRALLLCWRQVFVLSQPVAGMTLLPRRRWLLSRDRRLWAGCVRLLCRSMLRRGRGSSMMLLRAPERHARTGEGRHNPENGDCQMSGNGFPPSHMLLLDCRNFSRHSAEWP